MRDCEITFDTVECLDMVIMATPANYNDYNDYNETYENTSPCQVQEKFRFFNLFAPAAYIVIFILAVLGNILVLLIIQRYRQSHNSPCAFSLTDTFLLHLAISDLLLALTLPFFAGQWISGWVFTVGICKVAGALFSLNVYCGVFFLACISFDRYLAIVHAIHISWRRNTCQAQIACLLIWAFCLGLSTIEIVYRNVTMVPGYALPMCTTVFNIETSEKWQLSMQLLSMLLGFGLPLLIMLYCYLRILHALCHTRTRRQKRRPLRLIISLVTVFVVCWAPYNILKMIDSLLLLKIVSPSCTLHYVLDISILVTESLGLAHSALNPLLYGFVGVKFRRELLQMSKIALNSAKCFRITKWVHGQGRSRRPIGSFSSVESENTSYFSVVA